MAGNYSRVPETVCDPKDAGRKKFTMQTDEGTVTLTVPNYVEDKLLRGLVDQGKTLVEAYTNAGVWSILPEKGMRPCVYDALRIKYFSSPGGEWLRTGGQFTCIEYHHCFEDYLRSFREYPQKRGRIRIAEGVFVPSPEEEACIKGRFVVSKNLPKAYHDCGASDILPKWPGAVVAISKMLTDYPAADLYHVIKTLYYLQTQTPRPDHAPVHHHAPADGDGDEKGIPWRLLIIAGAICLLVLLPDDAGI